MLPGPDEVVACPACESLTRYATLISGNTFGSRGWSDGKVEAPMLPRPPEVVRCKGCRSFYWLSDAPKIGSLNAYSADADADAEWIAAPYVEEPTEREYFEAIEQGLGGPDREFDLRLLTWWRGNDPLRADGPVPNDAGSEDRRSNLEALAALIDGDSPEELLLKAEAFRELGRFADALQIVDRIRDQDYHEPVARLRSWCQAGDSTLREL